MLRPCLEADLDEVCRIYGHHVRTGTGSFEEVPPELAEMRARWQRVVGLDLPYLVAVEGGRVLGFSYAAPFHHRSAFRHTLEDTVYLAPDAVGRGIGKALVSEVLRLAGRAGYKRMVAVIGDSSNQGSIGLHRALGFEHAGILRAVGQKFGRWLDVVYMQRDLEPGDTSPNP
ncbi:N-acetyltransferase family protein [Amaricoccus macauensis]|uniref:GNAT family N-acetyltransferase n=1 Tax=Amaricoccus macauensis TaxID=57001 RepID=UPI003C7B5991